jgi:hypothetical protein
MTRRSPPEVLTKQVDDPLGVLRRQLDHEINVPRHARQRVVVEGHGPSDHVADTGALHPPGDDLQDFDLFTHRAVAERVDRAPPPVGVGGR